MKILFVDDQHERRIEFFKQHPKDEIFTAETCQNAIQLLEDHKFDTLYLDHDLSSVHDENNKSYDGKYPMLICTVRPLVEWLIALEWTPGSKHDSFVSPPFNIIIHSWNMTAGVNVMLDLREAGYNVEYRRFEFAEPNLTDGPL